MAFRKIGALWLKDGKDGSKYMSGVIDDALPAKASITIFKNTYKKEDKHPDYTINVREDEPQQQNFTRAPAAPPPGDEIPF